MKTLKSTTLIIALFLAGTFNACKKGGDAGPGNSGRLTNSAQLFFDDNTGIALQSNDAVTATYTDHKLKVRFNQNSTDVALEIPNYDISAESGEYNNATAAVNISKLAKTYNSGYIFVPVLVGNPPHPVFAEGESIAIKTNNLKVNNTTTDISIQIMSGSEITTVPVSNGATAVYDKITFVQGAGGKPNMINVRIKQ